MVVRLSILSSASGTCDSWRMSDLLTLCTVQVEWAAYAAKSRFGLLVEEELMLILGYYARCL